MRIAELVHNGCRFARRFQRLRVQNSLHLCGISHGDATNHNPISDPSITRNLPPKRHSCWPLWVCGQIDPKAEAFRFVNPKLQPKFTHSVRELPDSHENRFWGADGVAIVHVEVGGAAMRSELRVKLTHRIMDGRTETPTLASASPLWTPSSDADSAAGRSSVERKIWAEAAWVARKSGARPRREAEPRNARRTTARLTSL